jgi:hypothetical protein
MRPVHRKVSTRRYLCSFVAALVLLAPLTIDAASESAPALSFRLDEGRNINSFVRDGAVAAHLLLRSGTHPRILVAFPAGNSGVGLWFASADKPVAWNLLRSPRAVTLSDMKGRPLRGLEVEAVVDADVLRIERAVLSSVRVLRDYEARHTAPDEVLTSPMQSGQRISWTRDRLDGAARYRLDVEALGDARVAGNEIKRGASGQLRLKVLALTGEPALTPLGGASLLTAKASDDPRSRNVLSFLSYREKYLAGSWRFDTYFGRDTLMSVTLLVPALEPEAIERGIGSVLERLAPNGEVAHEEDIGEFAVLRNMKEGRGRSDAPIYDYGMVDDDFMLAPLAAMLLLDKGRARAAGFLASRTASGAVVGDALVRNFTWVVEQTGRFAEDPKATNLVSIKSGRNTGQWRDSEEGLGRGRYAYDINVALVPAALRAIERLVASGSLNRYLSEETRSGLMKAGPRLRVWAKGAAPFFVVTIPADQARAEISAYAASVGVDAGAALASVQGSGLAFNALSLDAAGKPVQVMHSDDGFTLLFGTPSFAEIERSIATASRPFPAGLATPIGMLVSNPAFAGREAQARFTSADYHGTVVWSWQQALMVAGMNRQLARSDLPGALRTRLLAARNSLWSSIKASSELRSSELWSWSFAAGCYRSEPFGQRRTDVDESNAAQLWSTVFLALPAPPNIKPAALCSTAAVASRQQPDGLRVVRGAPIPFTAKPTAPHPP